MSRSRHLRHVTLATGHDRPSPRSEVGDGVVDELQPLLQQALRGEHAPVPGHPGWTMTGGVHGRCCAVTIWTVQELSGGSAEPERVPVVTVGIAGHSRCAAHLWRSLHEDAPEGSQVATTVDDRPPTPWVAARLDIGAALVPASELYWIADLERCLGWAWLEMRQPSRY